MMEQTADTDDMGVVDDYTGGMSLDAVGAKHGITRSQVQAILRKHQVPRRNISEARRLVSRRRPLQQRLASTQAASQAVSQCRRPRGRQAKAVLSWCGQKMSLPHQALAEEFKARNVLVQALYPAGPYNIYLAVPGALLAIEPMPCRMTYKGAAQVADKLSYLLRKGWFVAYLGEDPMVHFDAIVSLAKMRSGAPLEIGQKKHIRQAMQPYVDALKKGHAAAVEMAVQILAPQNQAKVV